jgi:hypothetical protein
VPSTRPNPRCRRWFITLDDAQLLACLSQLERGDEELLVGFVLVTVAFVTRFVLGVDVT